MYNVDSAGLGLVPELRPRRADTQANGFHGNSIIRFLRVAFSRE